MQRRTTQFRCDGWWEQRSYGRQAMRGLAIEFKDGNIEGSGVDMVGPFLLTGRFGDASAVVLEKDYFGSHSVFYLGTYDGEGTMSGEWCLGFDRGRWAIVLRSGSPPADADIQDLEPRPKPAC